jgi:diadenylate cyclase
MDFLNKWGANVIFSIGQQAQGFWENVGLLNFSFSQVLFDIALVAILFYYIFLLLKGSRAMNILVGLGIVGFVFVVSKAFQLLALGWLLDRFFTVILVAIPVIFQQELRMALERIGHTKFSLSQKVKEINLMISKVVEACEYLAREKQGALIVFQNTVPLKEYIDTGILLQAKISQELLTSIFQPKSPLHDGAVIIHSAHIVAASCLLPHSFKSYGQTLGTRHKAALGLSETTDAKIIVISEEKGSMAFAQNGFMERNITPARLQILLTDFLKPHKSHKRRRKL